MIDLAVWQLNPLPALPACNREANAGIISYGHAIRLSRIDPNVMIVTAGTAAAKTSTAASATGSSAANQRLAAVGRTTVWIRQEVDFVFIIGRNFDAKIIMSAPAHSAIVTNQLPVLAAIVRTPKLAAISFLSVVRNAVASFD